MGERTVSWGQINRLVKAIKMWIFCLPMMATRPHACIFQRRTAFCIFWRDVFHFSRYIFSSSFRVIHFSNKFPLAIDNTRQDGCHTLFKTGFFMFFSCHTFFKMILIDAMQKEAAAHQKGCVIASS